jgi:penicillin-insensitive murein endopeptidase
VNFAVKKALCEQNPKGDWLRKIRPWYGHDYHFHVRLRCPASDTNCQSLPEIPAGNGCDESLAWWWSNEARFPGRVKKRSPAQTVAEKPKRLEFPDACEAVLAGR